VLFLVGFALFIIGFILAFIGVLISIFKGATSGGQVSGGGVILIGPFPIIFGSNRRIAWYLTIVALVFVIIYIILSIIPFFTG